MKAILKGGTEQDCLSRRSRRIHKFKAGVVKAAKRTFWKRLRKQARMIARSDIAGLVIMFALILAHPEVQL